MLDYVGKNGQTSIETVQKHSAAREASRALSSFRLTIFFRPFPTAEPGPRLSS